MPNLVIVAIALIVAFSIIRSSAKKDEQETRERISAMEHPPECYWESGEPSGGALVLVFVVIVGAVFVAMPR